MSNFGLPYMGSKAKIAASIALNFPSADNFYDLFGGGFSMSHYMLEKKAKRYKYFHYNEIKSDIVELVKSAVNGDFNYDKFKPEWISREMFHARKDTDAYVACIWSFGNNQITYLFGEDIEPYKKSMHHAVVFDEFDSFMVNTFKITKWPVKCKNPKDKRLYLKTLVKQRIDLEQLELERLQQLEQLSFSALDYRSVPIKENSVVYCDIPYIGTLDIRHVRQGYMAFNHKEFYEWAATRSFPVFISEYELPDTRFKLIYSVDKRSMLSQDKSVGNKSENLYWNGVTNV